MATVTPVSPALMALSTSPSAISGHPELALQVVAHHPLEDLAIGPRHPALVGHELALRDGDLLHPHDAATHPEHQHRGPLRPDDAAVVVNGRVLQAAAHGE